MARLLEIDALSVGYGKSRVLYEVSMTVDKGELVALIGTNGAGKSTLLKCLSGVLKPWSGSIDFEDRRIDGLPPDQIVGRGIAHCPEGRRVFPELTVKDNLRIGAYRQRTGWEDHLQRIYELFPRLKERQGQLAGTLSGGEQQMLAIGRALMSRPRLLLLDEPSLGLAPVLVEQVMKIIAEISKKEDITIMLVEQNASFALSISDRACVLEGGRFVKQGIGGDLLRDEEVRSAYLGV